MKDPPDADITFFDMEIDLGVVNLVSDFATDYVSEMFYEYDSNGINSDYELAAGFEEMAFSNPCMVSVVTPAGDHSIKLSTSV